MSYTLYRSPAIVIAHSPRGESDRLVTLFTRDHGLVRAKVQNARAAKSRLRYGAQFLAYGEFEYIRGKHTWRLVGAHGISYPKTPTAERPACAQVCADMVRLVQPEEPAPELYHELFQLVTQPHTRYQSMMRRVRILAELGYVDVAQLPETCDEATYSQYEQACATGLAAAQLW